MRKGGLTTEPVVVEVRTEEQARALGFRGSPSVVIGGRDVDEKVMNGEPSLSWG